MLKILILKLFILSTLLYSGSLSERITNGLQNISELKSIGYSLDSGEVFVVKRDGKYYKKFDTKPFSGRAVYAKKNILVRFSLSDGIKDGYFLVFSNTGNLLKEANYKAGKLDGKVIEWSRDAEVRLSEITYKNNMPCEGWIKRANKEFRYKDCKKSGYEFRRESSKVYKIIYENNEIKEKIEIKN